MHQEIIVQCPGLSQLLPYCENYHPECWTVLFYLYLYFPTPVFYALVLQTRKYLIQHCRNTFNIRGIFMYELEYVTFPGNLICKFYQLIKTKGVLLLGAGCFLVSAKRY
jgi:hypothetical protein